MSSQTELGTCGPKVPGEERPSPSAESSSLHIDRRTVSRSCLSNNMVYTLKDPLK
jgi:hypothetical protein